MAHFHRVLKARALRKNWKEYLRERHELQKKYSEEHESGSESSTEAALWLVRIKNNIRTPNTIEFVVWESFMGFMGGVFLTYLLFLFFHISVNISTWTATYICAFVGVMLSIGLAFSSVIRCYVLLLLPVVFSKQGRQALLTYALFLSFTGPGRNTMQNLGVLSDSMTCGQEMVKKTLQQIVDLTKAPDKAIKDSMHKMVKSVQEVVDSIRSFVMKLKRLIITVLNVFIMVSKWLGSVVNLCNKKVGTPFQRCIKVFDEVIADCKAKLGVMGFSCHVGHIVKALCYSVKCLDFMCLYTELVSDKAVATAKKKLREFHVSMKKLLSVSIEFNHSYKVDMIAINTTKQVSTTILQKLSKKMEKLQTIFSFFGFVFSLFFLFLFIKVYYYRYKYFSSDQYDNYYINRYILELDCQRAQANRETVLPLEPREKNYYTKPASIRLLYYEKNRITESLFLLGLTSFKIVTFLVVDYSLFWILLMIYETGRDMQYGVEESKTTIHVKGKGFLKNFYSKLGKTLQVPDTHDLYLTRVHCLPDPFPPDIRRYIQIGVLVTLCWLLTMTEAYGLRLRHIVMSHYYPDRARERAVWLYNHIILSRSCFVRYARRQLRRKFGKVSPLREKITLTQRLFANFPVLNRIFGRIKENNCLVCDEPENGSNLLRRCTTPDCTGRYCMDCFNCLESVCTICQHPISYGDISDISEEFDSSEDDSSGRTSESTSYTDECESQKFLTFKEMEVRDRFRDLEANTLPDYVKLGDLYSDKAALQRRLKAVIQRHLENIEWERNAIVEQKGSAYQHAKLRLKNVLQKLRNKKVEQIRSKKFQIKRQFLEKIQNLRALKEKKCKSGEDEIQLGEPCQESKSKVSFNLSEAEVTEEAPQADYVRLKNELKAKIQSLKQRRNLQI